MDVRTGLDDVDEHGQRQHAAGSKVGDGIGLLKTQPIDPVLMGDGRQSLGIDERVDVCPAGWVGNVGGMTGRRCCGDGNVVGVSTVDVGHDGTGQPQTDDEVVVRYHHPLGLFDPLLPPLFVFC